MQGREVGCWVNSLWTSSIDCAESGWRLSLPTSVSIELAERGGRLGSVSQQQLHRGLHGRLH